MLSTRTLCSEDKERIEDLPDSFDSTAIALSSVTSMAIAGTTRVIPLRWTFFGGSNGMVAPKMIHYYFGTDHVSSAPKTCW
jgi:hypothetical protein